MKPLKNSDSPEFTASKQISIEQRCYQLIKKIPLGKVTSYKLLAEALGTKAYRRVGQIVKANPYFPQVPCHRVVQSNGKLGGFAFGGTEKKACLLTKEGLKINDRKIMNLDQVLFHF